MSFEVDQLVDRILTGVSRGNDAYCLIYAGQNQKLQFIMRRCKFEIIKLWVSSPEGFWDEKSFSGILFFQKRTSKKGDAAFIRTDEKFKPVESSFDINCDLTCLAVCACSAPDANTGRVKSLCFKARYTPQVGTACLCFDEDCIKLFELEGATMTAALQRHKGAREIDDYETYEYE